MLDMIKKYFNSEKKVLINKHSSKSYQISFSGKKYRQIVDSLYDGATIYLERKKKKWDSFINYIDSNVKIKNCNVHCRQNYEGKYKFKNNEIRFKSNKKEVKQYDLQGNFIRLWENASSAAEKYNTTSKAIRKVCTGDRKSCCNYIWRYTDGVELKECRMVEQYDLNNNLIKVWKSCREAAVEYNVTFQAIRRAINGQYKTCCGYVWKYKATEN